MRCGEGLVQVDVHHVESHVAGTASTEHRVEVSAVVIHERAALVHDFRYLGYLTLEEPQGIGVGHHHRCHTVVEQVSEVINIHDAIGSALHLDDLQSADSGRGGVGAVRGVGHDNLHALRLATLLMIGTDNHQSGEFTVSTRIRIEGELAQSGKGSERFLQLVIHLEGTLAGGNRLAGV